jgi:hypothetical protein
MGARGARATAGDADNRVSRVGSHDNYVPYVAAFRKASTNFVEGQNVAIEYRWADGQYDRIAELATELVRLQVAIIAVPKPLVRCGKFSWSVCLEQGIRRRRASATGKVGR